MVASFFRVLEMFDAAYGFVVAFRIYAPKEGDPKLLALANQFGRNAFFDNPVIPVALPADCFDLLVDELLALLVLANTRPYVLPRDADVSHIGLVAPHDVHAEERDCLTSPRVFVSIHVKLLSGV